MTWETTHLALESSLVYIFLPKEKRKFYSNHKKEWFLISLLASVPDLDSLFKIHRSFSHSLVMVALYGLIVIPLINNKKDRNYWVKKHKVIKDAIILFPWFWMMHIILDFGFGPMQLFYPISTAFFDISFYLLISLKPLGPFPFVPYGISINFKLLTESTGLKSFIINMSYEERLKLFGTNKMQFLIDEFTIHASIFLAWCFWLMRDHISKKSRALLERRVNISFFDGNQKKAFKTGWKAFKIFGWLWLIGTTSMLASNSIPAIRTETGYAYWEITLVSDTVTPMQFLEANFPKKTTPAVSISLPVSPYNITIGVLISTDKDVIINVSSIVTFIDKWNNSFTNREFRGNYSSIIKNQEWYNSLFIVQLKENTTILKLDVQKTDYLLLGIILVNWGEDLSFVKSGEIKITSLFEQSETKNFFYLVGLISLLIPIIISLMVIILKYQFFKITKEKDV